MPPKPNIILIMCDQLRGDALGYDGNQYIETPNIDYLAAHGTRFNHAYTACPSCIPARAILWTGMDQWHTGILGMGRGQGPIPDDYPHTLAGELTSAGYQTHMVGKGHFHPPRGPMGFETTEIEESGRIEFPEFGGDDYRKWFKQHAPDGVTPNDHGIGSNAWQARPWHTEEYLHPTAWTMSQSLEFLKNRDKDRPFLLNISFARPHSPYVPPQAYWDMYADKGSAPPADVGDWAAMHDVPADAAHPDAWRGKLSEKRIDRARTGYYGEVSFVDAQIGRLLNYMKRFDAGSVENTWFIFTSDHGDMLGDHNLWRKTYAYEGSARIPLLICPPLWSEPTKRDCAEEVVELRDIMPTILDITGVEIPETVIGENLLPLTKAPAESWRTYIHGEHSDCYGPSSEMHYVTDGRRKFVWLPLVDMQQFFDLEADPTECHNLIDDPAHTDEVDTWRSYLVKELSDRDCGWVKDGQLYCPPDEPLVSPHKRN